MAGTATDVLRWAKWAERCGPNGGWRGKKIERMEWSQLNHPAELISSGERFLLDLPGPEVSSGMRNCTWKGPQGFCRVKQSESFGKWLVWAPVGPMCEQSSPPEFFRWNIFGFGISRAKPTQELPLANWDASFLPTPRSSQMGDEFPLINPGCLKTSPRGEMGNSHG